MTSVARSLIVAALALTLTSFLATAHAQTPGSVADERKLSAASGGLAGVGPGDGLASGVAGLGDIDGDGVPDLALGAPGFEGTGPSPLNQGAVHVLMLADDGSAKAQVTISRQAGGFTGDLSNNDFFGSALAPVGDLDGDGRTELAVLAPFDDDGALDLGAVWILLLAADGTVKSHSKISAVSGGLPVEIEFRDLADGSLAAIGDLDRDGVPDLLLGAPDDDDGGNGRGAVYVLFLTTQGTVKSSRKISDTTGGFIGILDDNDHFGSAVAVLDDLDADGNPELAVGADGDDDGGNNRGAVWVLFPNSNGTIKTSRKISNLIGGFVGTLDNLDGFGSCLAGRTDIDGDGIGDLVVGAGGDDDGAANAGAAWVLFPRTDASIKGHQKISSSAGGFLGTLSEADGFGGRGCAMVGDIDGDGAVDVVVGAAADDDEAPPASRFAPRGSPSTVDSGAGWVLFLNAVTPMTTTTSTTVSTTSTTVSTTTTTSSTSTTTLPPPGCGDPTRDGVTTATDARVALLAAVGAAPCLLCACDTDSSGAISASDALRILQVAVGVPIALVCPAC